MYRLVKILRYTVDIISMLVVLLVAMYAIYNIWDGYQTYESASTSQLRTYKPKAVIKGQQFSDEKFRKLQERNPDVFGWIDIFGTGINYPMVQGKDNDEYINHNPLKEFSLTGSIFLDSSTPKDFTNFTSVVYGHHMEKHKMFADLDLYKNKTYAKKHSKGNLYFNNQYHGLKVVAFIETTAYDDHIYRKVDSSETVELRRTCINYVKHKADYMIGTVDIKDKVVLLSTCADGTDRRYVVVTKLRDKPYHEPKQVYNHQKTKKVYQIVTWMGLVILLLLTIVYGYYRYKKRNSR